MDKIEKNTMNSFRLVKSDIVKLQQEVIELGESHENLIKLIADLKTRSSALEQKYMILSRKLSRPKKQKKGTVLKKVRTPPRKKK